MLAGEPLSENAHLLRSALATNPAAVNKVCAMPPPLTPPAFPCCAPPWPPTRLGVCVLFLPPNLCPPPLLWCFFLSPLLLPLHSSCCSSPSAPSSPVTHNLPIPLPQPILEPIPPSSLQVDFLPQYSSFLRDLIKKGVANKDGYHFPLAGFHIVVDAGNGSGGFFADQVRV